MEATTLERLLDACPTGVLVVNADEQVEWVNQTLLSMLGVARQTLVGRGRDELVREGLERLLDKDGALPWDGPHGQTRWLRCYSQSVNGYRARFYVDPASADPEHESAATLDAHWRHLTTDPITGLLNRRALLLALEPQVARSRRYGSPLSVVVVTTACREPDTVSWMAGLLREQLRWSDLIGYEAGVFFLALPETDNSAAQTLVDKIRASLDAAGSGQSSGLAFGISAWTRSDDGARLLRRAHEDADPPGEPQAGSGG